MRKEGMVMIFFISDRAPQKDMPCWCFSRTELLSRAYRGSCAKMCCTTSHRTMVHARSGGLIALIASVSPNISTTFLDACTSMPCTACCVMMIQNRFAREQTATRIAH